MRRREVLLCKQRFTRSIEEEDGKLGDRLSRTEFITNGGKTKVNFYDSKDEGVSLLKICLQT